MRVHFIKGKDGDIAYFCDTLEIKKVSPDEKALLESQMSKDVEYPEFEVEEEKYFSTLILHISNTCNMRCGYCFANHGTYGSKAAQADGLN